MPTQEKFIDHCDAWDHVYYNYEELYKEGEIQPHHKRAADFLNFHDRLMEERIPHYLPYPIWTQEALKKEVWQEIAAHFKMNVDVAKEYYEDSLVDMEEAAHNFILHD
jgi:hypothetical protein